MPFFRARFIRNFLSRRGVGAFARSVCGALLFLNVVSCSYTVRRNEVSMGGIDHVGSETLFVPVVDNLSTRAGVEGTLTNSLRNTLSAVGGVRVVDAPNDARFLLVTTLTRYQTQTTQSNPGRSDMALAGGLSSSEGLASEMKLTIGLRANLVERVPGGRRMVWTREFERAGVYQASRRVFDTGTALEAGSASAPLINRSREQVQAELLADALARLVVDQVLQDF